MAKLTGPLLSLGARGQIGKTLVSSKWKGIPYMRQYVIPSNPQTTAQTEVRTVFTTLNGLWLTAPALFRDPWTTNAIGQKYTNRNKLLAENIAVLQPALNMQNFIGSPGARGGPPLESIAAIAGGASGELDVSAVAPTIPTDWLLTGVVWVAFPDQDPHLAFIGPFATDEDLVAPYALTLTGLPPATLCVVSCWPVWQRPDAKVAYGPSLVTTGTIGA